MVKKFVRGFFCFTQTRYAQDFDSIGFEYNMTQRKRPRNTFKTVYLIALLFVKFLQPYQ